MCVSLITIKNLNGHELVQTSEGGKDKEARSAVVRGVTKSQT